MEFPINCICTSNLLLVITLVLLHFTSSLEFESFLQLPRSGFSVIRKPRKEVGIFLHVTAYGAVGDGIHDDTEAFRNAWKVACTFPQRATIIVPEGFTYLVQPIDFAACQTEILGAIIAPKDPKVWLGLNPRKWLYFHGVEQLTLEGGGTINGMGKDWWALSCKTNATLPCHHAPTAITFHRCKNLKVRDISIIDSQQTHITFTNCRSIVVSNVTLTAPVESPNTDGIHISASSDVQVSDTSIKTGDDCVSIVSNSSRIVITGLACGPGHGISIGSLGRWSEWSEVRDVMVDGAYLSNTQNGVRIKTWQGGAGYVRRVTFKNVWMENVTNPIIVDQYYCDAPEPCINQTSAVHVDKISFVGIKGTSGSDEAIRFACSDSSPCQGLYLEDIQLITYTGVATSFCWKAQGSSSGVVYPSPCFPTNESVI
ncbi:probable polygalacturonase At1g80170 isoform X2 [Beta vulgaris subsp. vulgaris]|uniref:probable polygalacturonase At1g80170 isoform X2 n=1 Tax=Beta vulgaris subsp. vulgaris TaxID=3555 RepID=UPI002036CC10|nr:probable polygalacturonase At1g80170 isoform X2 [Beta vulgaris subsp. vulgaris]